MTICKTKIENLNEICNIMTVLANAGYKLSIENSKGCSYLVVARPEDGADINQFSGFGQCGNCLVLKASIAAMRGDANLPKRPIVPHV